MQALPIRLQHCNIQDVQHNNIDVSALMALPPRFQNRAIQRAQNDDTDVSALMNDLFLVDGRTYTITVKPVNECADQTPATGLATIMETDEQTCCSPTTSLSKDEALHLPTDYKTSLKPAEWYIQNGVVYSPPIVNEKGDVLNMPVRMVASSLRGMGK